MSKYNSQASSALRLIAAKGQKMTLRRLAFPEAYDPVLPAGQTLGVIQSSDAYAVVLPASKGTIEAFDNRILSDPSQLRSFRFLILAAKGLTFQPAGGDILITTEGPYRILGVTPLDPAGDGIIIYNIGATLDTQIQTGEPVLLVNDGQELLFAD